MAERSILNPIQRLIGEDFNMPLFFVTIRKSIPWMIVFLVFSLGVAMIYLRYTPSIYSANSKLMFQQPTSSEALEFMQDKKKDVMNDMAIIQSRVFISRITDKLPLEISYFNRGNILVEEFYKNTPFNMTVSVKDSAIYNKHVDFKFLNKEYYSISYKLGRKEFKQERLKFGEFYSNSHFDFIAAFPKTWNLKMVINQDFYFVINTSTRIVSEIIRKLRISLGDRKAQTIKIRVLDREGSKAVDLVNTLAEEYREYDRERQMSSADNVLDFLNEQLDTITSDLLRHENLIKSFKLRYGIINPESEQTFLFNQLHTLDERILQLQLERNSILWLEKYIEDGNQLKALSGDLVEGAYVGFIGYIQQMITLENQREELLLDVTTKNIRIKYIEEQLKVTKESLLANAKNARQNVEFKLEYLGAQYTDVEGDYLGLPEKEAEFLRLNRLTALKEKFYMMLKEQQTEYEIIKAGIVSNFIVLSKARVFGLVSPKKRFVQLSGLVAGVLLSFLLVVVRYLSQNKILSLSDIEENTTAPILGVIPKFKEKFDISQVVVYKNPKAVISEAFRSVRTNLEFFSSKEGTRTLAVTSTVSSEGKTFIALNMAGVLNMMGKRVIILDFDMRKPKIHKAFEVDNTTGLSTILINKSTIEETIQKSPYEDFHFITSGPLPPNPAELILSDERVYVMDYLRSHYDYIVLDTPPVGLVADAIELIKLVDYPIYVMRAEHSKKEFINFPNKLYEDKRVPNIMLLLNDVKRSHAKYGKYGHEYGYGYGSGYGYGYGYGYYSEDRSRRSSKSMWAKFVKKLKMK